jgi:hypothetical protein
MCLNVRGVLSACSSPLLVMLACTRPMMQPSGPPVSAMAADSALGAMVGSSLWPGFQPMRTPIASFDGGRTWLFRHPGAPAEYRPVAGRSDVVLRDGRDSVITANSSAALGGVITATVMLDERWTATDAAAIAVHELFHVYQRARHPKWQANEVELFTYPVDDPRALALRREETSALRRAVEAPTDEAMRCWARAFIDVRSRRFAAIAPEASTYERGTELNEGLARYVEHRAARRTVRLADDPAAVQVRQRAYDVGAAIAAVLDRAQPDWRERLESSANPTPWLDSTLASAVGPADRSIRCASTVAERAGWATQASADVAGLVAERARTRAEFLGRAGWRLEVDAGGAAFFPQRFDPLNVSRLSSTEILHGRYLALQGSLGSVELLGGSALTEGIPGAHPLFAGVRRVTLTGLRTAPSVRDSAGTIDVRADGVRIRLRGARADTVGRMVQLRPR